MSVLSLGFGVTTIVRNLRKIEAVRVSMVPTKAIKPVSRFLRAFRGGAFFLQRHAEIILGD